MDLIGHKTTAIFDLWSLSHGLCGVAMGYFALHRPALAASVNQFLEGAGTASRISREKAAIALLLLLAYSWELIEFQLESGLAGDAVAFWFQGRENSLNRLVGDPLMLVCGYLVGRRFPMLVRPAWLLLAVWLGFFVFVAPHSMAYYRGY